MERRECIRDAVTNGSPEYSEDSIRLVLAKWEILVSGAKTDYLDLIISEQIFT